MFSNHLWQAQQDLHKEQHTNAKSRKQQRNHIQVAKVETITQSKPKLHSILATILNIFAR